MFSPLLPLCGPFIESLAFYCLLQKRFLTPGQSSGAKKNAENSEILMFAISLVYDLDLFVEKKACIGLDWI